MMGRRNNDERSQIQMLSIDDLVPQDHLIRKIDAAIDLSFIYDKVKDLYKPGGRESIDPVVLIKIVMIQYIFGIKSMRQTIKEIEVNIAYRWYLGYPIFQLLVRIMLEDLKELIFLKISLKPLLLKSLTVDSLIQKVFL